MNSQRRMRTESIFSLPIWPPVVAASILTVVFYALLLNGFLEIAMLKRYCLCHPVAYATVGVFFMAMSASTIKFWRVNTQSRLTDVTANRLEKLLQDAPLVSPAEAAQWLDTLWKSQPNEFCYSWLGRRIGDIVRRQIARGASSHLDEDLRELSKRSADQLHDSYDLIRTVSWAIPILGILGTVFGISDTLGRLDIGLLANGTRDAWNRLAAGLYFAFDSTVIGLVLTLGVLFTHFLVSRVELGLVSRIDQASSEYLMGWLGRSQEAREANSTGEALRQLSKELVMAVDAIVQRQAELWQQTISDAHRHWQTVTGAAGDQIQIALGEAIDSSLEKHAMHLEKVQNQGAAQIDSRWQQWQTSLSEQARVMRDQQRELIKQSELLTNLVTKSSDLARMDQTIDNHLTKLTDIDRFHDAAICLSEAVAMIGTRMERQGLLSKPSIRVVSRPSSDATPTTARGKAA